MQKLVHPTGAQVVVEVEMQAEERSAGFEVHPTPSLLSKLDEPCLVEGAFMEWT